MKVDNAVSDAPTPIATRRMPRPIATSRVAVHHVPTPLPARAPDDVDRMDAGRPESLPRLRPVPQASSATVGSPAPRRPEPAPLFAERSGFHRMAALSGIACATAAAGYGAFFVAASVLECSAPVVLATVLATAWVALAKGKEALFGLRSDGTLVRNPTVMRSFMPYIMTSRESARIDYQQRLRLDHTRAFVAEWNAAHGSDLQIKTFHVLLAAMQRANTLHPGLNRFVMGKRLFERNNYSASFVVKSEKKAYGALRTVKLEAIAGEDFAGYVRRINEQVNHQRAGKKASTSEREMSLVQRLPGALIQLSLWGQNLLDAAGMWPKALIDRDPLYASVFVANLGSLDKDEMPNVKHHLYEYGTISLFGTVCSVDESGSHPTVLINWTYDERVNDAHYCLAPLKAMRRVVENPHALLDTVDSDTVAALQAEESASAEDAVARERAMGV